MVATVLINEKNGAGQTATNKTSGTVRMKNADNSTVDTVNPMVIPVSGSDWSFEKWFRLNISVAPAVNIANPKFYTDGANGFGTGVLLWAKAVTAYVTPAEGTVSTGYINAFTYTSGAALSLDDALGPWTVTGDFGKWLVLLLEVASTATQGSLATETLTFSYDEI